MKTIQRIIVVCGLILFSAGSALCAGPNLLTDGGFELPVVGPGGLNSGYNAYGVGSTFGGAWTVIGSPAGNIALVPSTEYTTGSAGSIFFLSQEGSQSIDLSGETDNSTATGLQQTFSTIAGHSYTLSFYVGAITTAHWAPYNGNAVVNVQLNGSPLLTASNSDASGDAPTWKLFSSQFTATGSSTTLGFLNATTGSVGYNGLDNISVVEVPEPGTCGLVMMGAALALGMRRKQKRDA